MCHARMEYLKERDRLEHLRLHRGIILKWILKKKNVRCGMKSSASGEGSVVGSCEHGNEI
jgi:hypothetical protein